MRLRRTAILRTLWIYYSHPGVDYLPDTILFLLPIRSSLDRWALPSGEMVAPKSEEI